MSPEDKLKEYLGSFGLSWDDLMKMQEADPATLDFFHGGRCHSEAEYAELLAEKKSLYSDYYKLKNEQRDLLIYKANIERIMQLDEEEKERSRQRQQEEK